MRAFQRIASTPWAIEINALHTVLEIAARMGEPEAFKQTAEGAWQEGEPEAVAARRGERSPGSAYTTLRDGVAVLEVTGPIARYMNLFSYFSGGTSAELLAKEFTAAYENPDVRAILLNINSPGGTVDGTVELANMIYSARKQGKKPVRAYVSSAGCSGAYWIAAAADQIVMNKSAYVGSIGIVVSYLDTRKADEAAGKEEIEIVSSNAPKKRPDLKTDEGRAQIQRRLDDLEAVFIADVAKFRGVSVETVRSDYGQGDVLVGRSAVKAGMADRLGTFESVLAELSRGGASSSTSIRAEEADAPDDAPEKGKPMSLKDKLKALLASEGAEAQEQAPEGAAPIEEKPAPAATAPATPETATPEASTPETPAADAALEQELEAARQRIAALEAKESRSQVEAKLAGIELNSRGAKLTADAQKNLAEALCGLPEGSRETVLGALCSARVVELGAKGFQGDNTGDATVTLSATDEQLIREEATRKGISYEVARDRFVSARQSQIDQGRFAS